jgi:poly-gamma-glutamate synthesis protein (capsule biosynthesis protein)
MRGGDMREAAKKIIIIICSLILCALSGCSAFVAEGNPAPTPLDTGRIPHGIPPSPTPDETPALAPSSSPTPVPTPTPEPYTDIIIGGTGDIMGHIQQIDDAYLAAGQEGYSFYHWFEYIKDALGYPDLMIANLEGPIAGEERGYEGYPLFNFPDEIVPAMKDAGIDVVLNGNNHIMDKGIAGIGRTIDVLDEAGMLHTGAWKSQEDRNAPLVIDVSGIKVGVVSATYSLNGFARHIDPEVLSYLVCFIEEEQVKAQIDLCKDSGAEVIVVCPHMGDEFEAFARRGIRNYAESYIAMGADIVFASHPHVLQPVVRHTAELEDGTTRSGIIFYSLGNFISSMYTAEKEAGAIAYVNIRRDNMTGEISITSAEYLPTWVMRKKWEMYAFHILPVGQSLDIPETIESLGPNKGAFYKLEEVWESTTAVMGVDAASPLRYVPER